MAVTASVVSDADDLKPDIDAWDRLAVLCRQPYSAPAWTLAWWRNLAPKGSRLAVTVVRDGDELVGLGAWYSYRRPSGLRIARLLGSGHRIEPLSVPGREPEVAEAMSDALRRAADPPGALLLDRADLNSEWLALLSDTWGRATPPVRLEVTPAPTLTIAGRSHEQYLAGRSGNFRSQRKRALRKLAPRGLRTRMVSSADDLDDVVRTFVRLHHALWDSRGTPSGLLSGTEQMLLDSVPELVPQGRMRIWLLEAEDTTIAAEILLTADGETACWSGGFDPEWSDVRPGFVTLDSAIRQAFDEGDRRIDLGGGAHSYKTRLADADEPIASSIILAGGHGRALRAAQLMPDRMGKALTRLAKELPPGLQAPLRAVRDAVAGRARR